MEVYTTENEQVDALRRFLAENGKALVVGVVLGQNARIRELGGNRAVILALKHRNDRTFAIARAVPADDQASCGKPQSHDHQHDEGDAI